MSMEGKQVTIRGKSVEEWSYLGTYDTDDETLAVIVKGVLGNLVRSLREAQDYIKELEAKLEFAVNVKGQHFHNGQSVEGYFDTSRGDTLTCGLQQVDELLELKKQLDYYQKTTPSINNIIKSMAKNSGEVKAEELTEKEATERYGEKIIASYKQLHKGELLEELMPEFLRLKEKDIIKKHRQEIIDNYKATHTTEFVTDERIEQIKAEAIEEFKASCGNDDVLARSRKTRQDKSERLTAYIISQLIAGTAPSKIDKTFEGKEFSLRTISRLAKVHNNEDKERIINAYRNNLEQFEGVTEEQMLLWINKKYDEYVNYIKKLTGGIQNIRIVDDKPVDLNIEETVSEAVEVDEWGKPIVKEDE